MAKKSKVNIEIGAKTKDAERGIGRVTKKMGDLTKRVGKFAAIGTAGLAVGIGVGAVKAAADFEMLKLRLEGVTGSAKKAEAQFKETFALFVKTPLDLEPLLNARILLGGIGVTGTKALESVASAATAMGRSVEDMAATVAALETEPLRRLGIEIKREGDVARFVFRNKMGREIKLVTQGIEQARQALLKIFDIKFGGFLGKAADTFLGRISSLKGLLKAAGAQLGGGLKDVLGEGVGDLNARLEKLIKGGGLESFGKSVGEFSKVFYALFSAEGRGIFLSSLKGVNEAFLATLQTVLSTATTRMGAQIEIGIINAMGGMLNAFGHHGAAAAAFAQGGRAAGVLAQPQQPASELFADNVRKYVGSRLAGAKKEAKRQEIINRIRGQLAQGIDPLSGLPLGAIYRSRYALFRNTRSNAGETGGVPVGSATGPTGQGVKIVNGRMAVELGQDTVISRWATRMIDALEGLQGARAT